MAQAYKQPRRRGTDYRDKDLRDELKRPPVGGGLIRHIVEHNGAENPLRMIMVRYVVWLSW